MFQVENNMRPVVIGTCLCFISLVALSCQIVLNSPFKISYGLCFILLILHLSKLVEFSESIDDSNQKIASIMYFDSKWYAKSKKIQKMISLMILRNQKSEHYTFHGGFVTFDRPLLLELIKNTYSFINILLYMK